MYKFIHSYFRPQLLCVYILRPFEDTEYHHDALIHPFDRGSTTTGGSGL
jgi:hypothetical protein